MSDSTGIIFILSAPSGGGKTSLARGLIHTTSNLLLSISTTTRKPRSDERNGVEYFFKTQTEFSKLLEQGLLLEYAKIYDNYYGTIKSHVYEPLAKKIDILFDIDWQGLESIKQMTSDIKVVSIFILPPNLEILRQRLVNRDPDSNNDLQQRLNLALEEISHARNYDYIVINDDFEKCLADIKAIITAERIRHANLDSLNHYIAVRNK